MTARLPTVAVLALLATGCGQATGGQATGGRTMNDFDTATWRAGAGNHDGRNPRAEQVAAARDAGVRVGALRTDIRALLGDPDSTGPEADIWYLGRDTMSVDFRALRVDYDASRRATKVEDKAS